MIGYDLFFILTNFKSIIYSNISAYKTKNSQNRANQSLIFSSQQYFAQTQHLFFNNILTNYGFFFEIRKFDWKFHSASQS